MEAGKSEIKFTVTMWCYHYDVVESYNLMIWKSMFSFWKEVDFFTTLTNKKIITQMGNDFF